MAFHSLAQLDRLLERVRTPMSLREILPLVEELALHGHPDALPLLRGMRENISHERGLERLARYEQAHHEIAARFDYTALGENARARFYSPAGTHLFRCGDETGRLAVCFVNPFNNCFVSNAVFGHLLSSLDCDTLFLKDANGTLFLDGAPGFSVGQLETGRRIRAFAEQYGYGEVVLVGTSGGAYPALLTAAQMGDVPYIGFSTTTTADPNSPINAARDDITEHAARVNQRWRVDLKPLLADLDPSHKRVCVYGENNEHDRLYAEHVADLDTVQLLSLGAVGHDTVIPALAAGAFFPLFCDVFGLPVPARIAVDEPAGAPADTANISLALAVPGSDARH